MFITEAYAQAAGGGIGGGGIEQTLLLVGGMVVFFYFFMIRPQQKRQKEQQAMITAISKGDEVLLNSGIYGRISKVGEGQFSVEIAKDVEISIRRDAILQVLPKGTIK
ncbi:MAG: preprotein translocase subunit YajC [Saezia sp.]